MCTPKLVWVIDGAIPARDLTIISGRPKVGKTRLAIALIKSVLQKQQFLDYQAPTEDRKVIFITDDQGDADTYQMLNDAGLYHHPNLIWSRRFRTTEKQLDALLKTISAYPDCLVIPDSLRSITRSTGVLENDVQMGMLLYDLKQAVVDAIASLVLIHHANKSDDQVGGEAVSGHSSIVGAANSIFTVHYLKDKKGFLQKDSDKRRIVREARSGAGLDVVARFAPIGLTQECTFDELARKEDKEAEADKRVKDLLKIPPAVTAVLDVIYENNADQDKQFTVLGLMKEAKLCRKDIEQKKDLNKTEHKEYNLINTKFRLYKREGFIEATTDASGRRQFLSLTDKGMVFVGEGLVVSANSSIPSVTPTD